MVAAAMTQSTLLQSSRVQSFTSRRPARAACSTVCRASDRQVARPIKAASGVAAFVLSAAAALQLVATPPAEAIATQTDMYARPQMSDTKNKTGQVAKVAMPFAHKKHKALQAFSSLQPEQAKDPLEAGSGAIAADPGKENRKLPKGAELADENSRMMRSTSGSAARGPGGKANK